jgi:hypothetical protein
MLGKGAGVMEKVWQICQLNLKSTASAAFECKFRPATTLELISGGMN